MSLFWPSKLQIQGTDCVLSAMPRPANVQLDAFSGGGHEDGRTVRV